MAYYGCQASFTLTLLALGVAALFLVHSPWLRLLDAVLFAFVFTQLAYIVHDAGHRQIFARPWHNDIVMLIIGLLVGSSRSWWFEIHNRHHSNPNNVDLDPHMAIVVLAFSEQQAEDRSGLLRFTTRFQAYYFFPLLLLEGVGVRLASIQFLVGNKSKYQLVEALGIAVHLVLYAILIFAVMPVAQAVMFIVVHQSLTGLYMGSVFAPNHKGMLVNDETCRLDFLRRQVLSSRNIKPHPLVDFWYGGLNYQIEHHLFPLIPRNKLREARAVVKEFCAERSIPYHETGVIQSYAEIVRYLDQVVAPLRLTEADLT